MASRIAGVAWRMPYRRVTLLRGVLVPRVRICAASQRRMIDGIDARIKDLSQRSNSVSAVVICIILAACGMRRGRDAKRHA